MKVFLYICLTIFLFLPFIFSLIMGALTFMFGITFNFLPEKWKNKLDIYIQKKYNK